MAGFSCEKLDMYVDDQQLAESAIEVVKRFKPNWPSDEIRVKVFTDGITNRLVGCYLDSNQDEVTLIRVYGEKTELFIDRQIEIRNMQLMHNAGLSPPLFGSFQNGVCYGFTPGKVLNQDMVRDIRISKLIAEKLAEMHSVITASSLNASSNEPVKPMLFRVLRRYLELIPENQVNLSRNVPKKSELEQEVNFLENQLSLAESPIVFCHNDLLLKNVIYQDSPSQGITFIDFEYADFNYQAFDIANHFCEFAGVENFDASLCPSKDFQLTWLKNYLTRRHQLVGGGGKTSIELEAEALYFQVRKFMLAAHLFWGTWSLIQAEHSTIKFDFLGYALSRLNEYFSSKSTNLNGHH
ncbi:Ethanolamine kinase 2 [Halotydeus destructor]|nr:Ethanolamine kinase 2 [Halotydeus destructor]